jgi:hypothetical protein
MYERHYGYRYDETKDLSTTEIAKRIREDIKVAKSEGLLPTRWAYSVRSAYFSGGSSIDVTVRDCADAWVECDGGQNCHNVWCSARRDPAYAAHASAHQVLSDEAAAAKITLERIHNAYNHDGSEIQVDYFDVNYYGQVSFEDACRAESRAAEKARLADRKAAREQAAKVETKKVVVYGRQGSRKVHQAAEVDGRIRLLCGSTLWRHSFVSAADQSEELSCKLCARKEVTV